MPPFFSRLVVVSVAGVVVVFAGTTGGATVAAGATGCVTVGFGGFFNTKVNLAPDDPAVVDELLAGAGAGAGAGADEDDEDAAEVDECSATD